MKTLTIKGLIIAVLICLLWFCSYAQEKSNNSASKRFQPNWESISSQYKIPEWYKDAKFGIFIHWGVYAVPAFHDEWYPRWMYKSDEKSEREKAVFDHHIATYGPQDKFGYKDFIPMFKAEKWNPEEWAELFKLSGARYVVPVAEHHDGFSMYNSDINPWNSVKMGPKRDIVGELRKAVLANGMHFGLSSHRAEHWWFFEGGRKFPSDVQDTAYYSLYGPARAYRKDLNSAEGKAFLEDWLARCNELIEKYQPELVYFDVVGSWSKEFQPYIQQFAANYYNQADRLKREGVVINYKTDIMAKGAGVFDIERDVSDTARSDYWQTDNSVGAKSWSYIKDENFKSPKQLINEFVDIVSKNGNLLLNIGPKADGTIPDEPRNILLAFGKWLKVNGEAIYSSRPAAIAAEGITKPKPKGPGQDRLEAPYTSADIRFTKKGDVLYAIALGWPNNGKWLIKTLAKENKTLLEGDIKKVELLGSTEKLVWKRTIDGLEIVAPKTQPCDYAFAFRIEANGVKDFNK
jgi:alpha-L-fucosidase